MFPGEQRASSRAARAETAGTLPSRASPLEATSVPGPVRPQIASSARHAAVVHLPPAELLLLAALHHPQLFRRALAACSPTPIPPPSQNPFGLHHCCTFLHHRQILDHQLGAPPTSVPAEESRGGERQDAHPVADREEAEGRPLTALRLQELLLLQVLLPGLPVQQAQ